jgi:chromosomal replication initiator protein
LPPRVDSARKIEGVIKQIQSAIDLQNATLDEDLIDRILKSEVKNNHRKIRVKPQDVIKAVANHYHVKQTALKGKGRVKHLVQARHVAMYLLCNELGLPLKETGRWFSNRDHTSVLHARDKIEKLAKTNGELQQDINALKMSLQAISK